jgi:hypothetical protein
VNDDGRPPKEPATANNTPSATTPATGAEARLDSTGVAVNFGELLLGTLDLAEHEYTAIGYADTAEASPSFITGVGTPAEAVAVAAKLPDTADVYFSVNAVRPRQPGDTRRGGEADVTRLTALYADLDVKPGGCPTLDVAHAIAAEVGVILDSTPAAFVESGHGLHPYWVIEDGHIEDGDITAARTLVHRFGRLVAAVAKNHRVAVDGVYDLARMLRVPGTLNNKVGADGQAVPVVAYRGTGRPLSMAEVAERLDEVGIEETDEDRTSGDAGIVSPPTGWQWAETTCSYVAAMIGGWATDTPTGRNPWHYANRIRLECARRNGCLTEADYRRAEQILADRLTELVATTEPRRALKRLEIAGAGARAVGVAAAKSDADVARELGWHNHVGTATAEDFWGISASPAVGRLEPASDYLSGTDDAPPDGQGAQVTDGRPAAPSLASRLLTRSALRELADPEPLIDNVIDQGTCALLYGHRGTYKSFIALDWALSVATGRPWQGRPTEQRRVLYVAAEGAFGFKGRTDAWEIGWRRQVSDDEFLILPKPVNLTDPGEVAELGALIAWGGYGLVVLDTMARCTVGAEENSAKDIGQVVDQMYRLLNLTPDGRGVVLGVHHTGKDGNRLRGSSAYEAGVDSLYSVKRPDRGGPVILDREKRKDGPESDRHELKLALIDGTNSGVMQAVNLSALGVDKSNRGGQLLSIFVQNFPTTGASKAELRAVSGMPPSTFYRAVNELLKSGDLINTGTDKQPFYMMVSK